VSYEGFERASLPLLGSQILARKGGKQVSLAAGGDVTLPRFYKHFELKFSLHD